MNNIDILEEMIKPIATKTFLFSDGRKEEKEIYNLERKQIEAISTLIAENKELKEKIKEINEEYNAEQKHEMENTIPKSKVEELLKEKIEWCIKASNSGLNAIQYACSKEDEIERIERQKNISTMISILKEMLQELLDERNNTDE